MKRETRRFVLYTLAYIIILSLLVISTFLLHQDKEEQNSLLLNGVVFIAIYPILPILNYRNNFTKKISEITQVFRFCYNCGTHLKPNEVKSCTKCGYQFPFDKLKPERGFFRPVFFIGFIFISSSIFLLVALSFRNLIDPFITMSYLWLFLVGDIIFISISIRRQKKRTQRILAEMQQDLKYCFSCGGALSTSSEERCPHCGYKFLIGDLKVLII